MGKSGGAGMNRVEWSFNGRLRVVVEASRLTPSLMTEGVFLPNCGQCVIGAMYMMCSWGTIESIKCHCHLDTT